MIHKFFLRNVNRITLLTNRNSGCGCSSRKAFGLAMCHNNTTQTHGRLGQHDEESVTPTALCITQTRLQGAHVWVTHGFCIFVALYTSCETVLSPNACLEMCANMSVSILTCERRWDWQCYTYYCYYSDSPETMSWQIIRCVVIYVSVCVSVCVCVCEATGNHFLQ